MSRKVLFLSFAYGIAVLSACAAGVTINLSPSNTNLLNGHWEGMHVSRGMDGVVYFQTPVILRISNGTGQFSQGENVNWTTLVEIRNGKVIVTYGRYNPSEHEFVLKKVDGQLQLVSEYNTTRGEWDRIATVSLTKKP